MPSKCILLMLDGLGDRAHESLGHKTPLEAADTPTLDKLARIGSNGLFHCDRPGVALPSENAHFALFGYSREEFPGRGILEAVGADIPVAQSDVALLAHFVSVKEENGVLILQKDRPEATPQESAELVSALAPLTAEGFEASFVRTRGLDGIVIMRGGASTEITDSDPLQEGMPLIHIESLSKTCGQARAAAVATARCLRKFLLSCYTSLDAHRVNAKRDKQGKVPINMIATHRPGRLRKVPPFEKRWALRGLSISSGIIYWGLCAFLGMEIIKVRDSGNPGRDLAERLGVALENLEEYDFVHVHSKMPDAAAHAKDPQYKKRVIEELDRGVGDLLDDILDNPEILLVVTSDHSTPSSGPLIHSGETVPITLAGPGIRRDKVKCFSEIDCAAGVLGTLKGSDFMPMVLNALDRAKLQGLMDTPEDQPYWPGKRKPFRA